MKITSLAIPDVKLVESQVYGDDRGFFLETWSQDSFSTAGISAGFVQDNWSRSHRGVLRGIHIQMRHSQGKLIRCVAGSIYDVAVDLRPASPTFGQWVGVFLDDENKRSLWIPKGFGHAFLAVSEWADLCYKVTDIYDPGSEVTLAWNDPTLGISWPLDGASPQLSEKDRQSACSLEEYSDLLQRAG